VFNEMLAEGAVIAAPMTSSMNGTTTTSSTWFSGDLDVADDIVACANRQLRIDSRRIYTAGCSFGAVQAGAMAYQRSRYVAAAMLNSGGLVMPLVLEDAAHPPRIITAHGASGTDVVIVDFALASVQLGQDVVAQGGFAVDCDHGGGHCGAPAAFVAAQWQFLKDHPFATTPSPYAAGLPASFPSSCQIVNARSAKSP
jgi:poly(3-hydroxybutyrate) depolymerase